MYGLFGRGQVRDLMPEEVRDGLATDYVVDAVLASGKSGKWMKVKQTKAK